MPARDGYRATAADGDGLVRLARGGPDGGPSGPAQRCRAVCAAVLRRQGLISADRTAANQCRYRGDVLCRVAMIRVCQQAGLSLAQIKTALAEAVPDGQIPGPQEWEQLAQHLRREVTSHISDLDRLLSALARQNGDAIQPPSPAPAAGHDVHPRRNADPPDLRSRRSA